MARTIPRPHVGLRHSFRVILTADGASMCAPMADHRTPGAPDRAPLVLGTLILVASVANINLAAANVALPEIGRDLDASQTGLNLVAVGYSLGLAASVLYLGALGDRHGRKMMLLGGMALSIPAGIVAALAPSLEILFAGRVIGGVAAGMAYPTTLALITALWSGAPRTRAIALWSAIGGAASALGPLAAGLLLEQFAWGSVFLLTVPLAVLGAVLALRLVPAHVNETSDPVDNLGGIISVVLVAALILGINFAAVPGALAVALGLVAIALAATVVFVLRQRRAANPLYDLQVAGRRVFWVAALAGIIVFGSLMGAMFVGQQFLQNVLGYSTLESGAAMLPAALAMVLVAPRSAKLVEEHGARATLLLGYVFVLLGFVTMLLLWDTGAAYWHVSLAYIFVGIGVGLAGTPASRSLTGSVPVRRAGMASGTADLQRDLGGAIMQSIFGALLTAGYAASVNAAIASAPPQAQEKVTDDVQAALTKSFSSAEQLAEQYPQYQTAIVAAVQSSFVDGSDWTYVAGIAATLLGAALVFALFPRRDDEQELLAAYHAADADADAGASATPSSTGSG
jgi:EmrB/QacA subfamily drug resistance transporter